MNLYSVYDRKSEAYSPPQTIVNDGVAIRMFNESCKSDPDSMWSKYYEDFSLFCLGEFDEKTGMIDTPYDQPRWVANAPYPFDGEALCRKATESVMVNAPEVTE